MHTLFIYVRYKSGIIARFVGCFLAPSLCNQSCFTDVNWNKSYDNSNEFPISHPKIAQKACSRMAVIGLWLKKICLRDRLSRHDNRNLLTIIIPRKRMIDTRTDQTCYRHKAGGPPHVSSGQNVNLPLTAGMQLTVVWAWESTSQLHGNASCFLVSWWSHRKWSGAEPVASWGRGAWGSPEWCDGLLRYLRKTTLTFHAFIRWWYDGQICRPAAVNWTIHRAVVVIRAWNLQRILLIANKNVTKVKKDDTFKQKGCQSSRNTRVCSPDKWVLHKWGDRKG